MLEPKDGEEGCETLSSGHGVAWPSHSETHICELPAQDLDKTKPAQISSLEGADDAQAPPLSEPLLTVDSCWGGGGPYF